MTHRKHWRHQLLENRRALCDALLLLLTQAQQRCYSCMPLLAGLSNALSSVEAGEAAALHNTSHNTMKTCVRQQCQRLDSEACSGPGCSSSGHLYLTPGQAIAEVAQSDDMNTHSLTCCQLHKFSETPVVFAIGVQQTFQLPNSPTACSVIHSTRSLICLVYINWVSSRRHSWPNNLRVTHSASMSGLPVLWSACRALPMLDIRYKHLQQQQQQHDHKM
jgi:hypothetical protein